MSNEVNDVARKQSSETRSSSETRISSANFLLSLLLSYLTLASTLLSLDAQLKS